MSYCSLNEQDLIRVGDLVSGLPNLVTLSLAGNNLDTTGELLRAQFGRWKSLQHLLLNGCSLSGENMVNFARSLSGLPNLVTLDLSYNDLRSKAALLGLEIKKFKALKYLKLTGCKMTLSDQWYVKKFKADTNIKIIV